MAKDNQVRGTGNNNNQVIKRVKGGFRYDNMPRNANSSHKNGRNNFGRRNSHGQKGGRKNFNRKGNHPGKRR